MKLEEITKEIRKIRQRIRDYWKADYDKIVFNSYGYIMRR